MSALIYALNSPTWAPGLCPLHQIGLLDNGYCVICKSNYRHPVDHDFQRGPDTLYPRCVRCGVPPWRSSEGACVADHPAQECTVADLRAEIESLVNAVDRLRAEADKWRDSYDRTRDERNALREKLAAAEAGRSGQAEIAESLRHDLDASERRLIDALHDAEAAEQRAAAAEAERDVAREDASRPRIPTPGW